MYNNKSILSKSAEILIDIGCVNFDIEKKFKLTSGKYSPVYCDCRKIISFPKQREILMDFSIKLIKSQKYFKKIDVIAGGETAGIPFASIIATKLNLPLIYIRKEQKSFGKKKKIEGNVLQNSNVLLVEDLLTDGGSKKHFFNAIKEEKLNLVSTFVIFNYGIFNEKIKLDGFSSKLIFLTDWKSVLDTTKSKNILLNKEINFIKTFLKKFGVKN